jgi:hypothetical protein
MSHPPRFPTRQYAYTRGGATTFAAEAPQPALEAGAVYRFIMGRDALPVKLADVEIEALQDPFARFVLGRGRRPQTMRDLLAALDAEGGPDAQRVFVIADGGQIPWTPPTASLDRLLRFLVTRGASGDGPTLFVSTTTPFDSDSIFLQVIGWDAVAGAYQFYERRGGAWVWAGSSWDALADDSRGKGPFDSHVNGALNMKELKEPWVHWHSMSSGIQDEVLAPDDPLRGDPLWLARDGAEQLETEIVRPGIRRWNAARFRTLSKNGEVSRLPQFMRQVLDTSTVNLVASPVESRRIAAGVKVPLPVTFFFDADALLDVLGLDPDLPELPAVDGGAYLQCLRHYDVAITDGQHRFAGDTRFAFVVPEPAFEDVLVLEELRRLGVLPDKLAASLLMVDFTNPVFSARRASLLRHVPPAATLGPNSDFGPRFLAAVELAAAAAPEGSPEHELLGLWRLPDASWRSAMESLLAGFMATLLPRLTSFASFAPLFELAESRRREFRKRPLAEFRLTLPVTNIPEDAKLLELRLDGSVHPKP